MNGNGYLRKSTVPVPCAFLPLPLDAAGLAALFAALFFAVIWELSIFQSALARPIRAWTFRHARPAAKPRFDELC